jgi:hypothetical protein
MAAVRGRKSGPNYFGVIETAVDIAATSVG